MIEAACTPEADQRRLDAIADWLGRQRWFPAGADVARAHVVAGADLGPTVRVLLVDVDGAVLQVPVLLGPDGEVAAPVVDAAGAPSFVERWLAHAEGCAIDVDPDRSRLMSVDQSNTSVVLSDADGPVGVLKVLRVVHPGPSPEVDVPRRLREVGWDGVPEPLGWLRCTWPGTDEPAYLGSVSEFVPGAVDGFALAVDHASRGASFEVHAGRLGALVAGMHRNLVAAFGTEGPTPTGWLVQTLRARFVWARAQVPGLARHAGAVEALAERLGSAEHLPARQRIHGDLHLGQVLLGDRWFVTDFEGEPLEPLAARTALDLPARDVAGMLRSFDYAGAVGGATDGRWASDSRSVFLSTYRRELLSVDDDAAPDDGSQAQDVLTALEVHKALYEVVYETRHRPDWVTIPGAGLDRLLAG